MARPPRPPRGTSLIELMIAMAVIAVGLLAMWHLHVLGLTSNSAGRRQTVATAIARELVSGLERLAYTDPLIGGTDLSTIYVGPGTTSGPPADVLFGSLVDGSGNLRTGTPPYRQWNDASQVVPGVRLDSQIPGEGGATYQRRWTVWGVTSPSAPANAVPGVKLIAVSVTWRDPPFARLREVVLYAQVPNPGSIVAGLAGSP